MQVGSVVDRPKVVREAWRFRGDTVHVEAEARGEEGRVYVGERPALVGPRQREREAEACR